MVTGASTPSSPMVGVLKDGTRLQIHWFRSPKEKIAAWIGFEARIPLHDLVLLSVSLPHE
jgi:hypothetical protein